MFCDKCLDAVLNKLLIGDIKILEYLVDKNSMIPQSAISREVIKNDTGLSLHKCYTGLERLECLGMIDKQPKSKASKYFITQLGKKALKILDMRISEGVN